MLNNKTSLSEMTKSADMSRLIVVGDRVLIKPKTQTNKSRGGLYLPAGYTEKEEVQSGYVIRTGPGYPIPVPTDENEEPWKHDAEKTRYIPLQAKEGDMAIFMQKGAVEILYHGEKYFIVPQHSILLLERDEELFD
jgi:co-chaperonin GroES (HSP10)